MMQCFLLSMNHDLCCQLTFCTSAFSLSLFILSCAQRWNLSTVEKTDGGWRSDTMQCKMCRKRRGENINIWTQNSRNKNTLCIWFWLHSQINHVFLLPRYISITIIFRFRYRIFSPHCLIDRDICNENPADNSDSDLVWKNARSGFIIYAFPLCNSIGSNA